LPSLAIRLQVFCAFSYLSAIEASFLVGLV
jgi:hypothetical protein